MHTKSVFMRPQAWLSIAMCVAVLAIATLVPDAARAEDKAVAFMRRAANALIAAQRQGSPEAFQRVIARYGHVPEIGLAALGDFRSGLHRKHRSSYYRGLARYIGRYAALEGRKYPVARVAFKSYATSDGRAIYVDSQVHLRDGSVYDVRWKLVQSRGVYKVRDAQVLGFWVSPFLQNVFLDYIRQNGGRVQALVIALNR